VQTAFTALVNIEILHYIHIHLAGSQGNGKYQKGQDDHLGSHGTNVLLNVAKKLETASRILF
jgi:hypothetical protein